MIIIFLEPSPVPQDIVTQSTIHFMLLGNLYCNGSLLQP